MIIILFYFFSKSIYKKKTSNRIVSKKEKKYKENFLENFYRLLVQLEETERTFDLFWTHHSSRLRHCLALRQFEQDFRELQATLGQHLKTLDDEMNTEVGETVIRVDQLLRDTTAFQRICRVGLKFRLFFFF